MLVFEANHISAAASFSFLVCGISLPEIRRIRDVKASSDRRAMCRALRISCSPCSDHSRMTIWCNEPFEAGKLTDSGSRSCSDWSSSFTSFVKHFGLYSLVGTTMTIRLTGKEDSLVEPMEDQFAVKHS